MLPFNVRVDLTFKVEDFFGGSVYFKSEHLLTERYFHNPSFRGGVKRQVKETDLATHSGKQVAWLVSIR